MGFQHGLSGLNAASRNLDVIGNNVANVNTVGAKSSRAEFADLYANSLSGAGASFSGIGVTVGNVSQQFTQGDIATTSNPMDLAINGRGFFRMSTNGTISYSRNGQFKLDKDGYLINGQNGRLTGYVADATGNINVGVPGDIRLNSRDTAPFATTNAVVSLNLDARATVPTAAFNVNDSSTYSGATSLTVYDQQGQEHTVSMYFRKNASNTWDIHAAADGAPISATPVKTLGFNTDGTMDLAATSMPFNLTIPVGASAGGSQTMSFDMSKVTQFGSLFGVSELRQDGFTTGRLVGFSVAGDGSIQARYTNGQTLNQGKLVLSTFANPQGLAPLGGNQWAETVTSGQPLVGAPGSGSLGVLQAGAVEQSNIDLTGELVNMITAQRVFQANAQTIRAQDQVLQTIVNLR
jgi:flagellar hook protein FlgE